MNSATDCLGRIPYASVIGYIMIFVGAGIMCGTLYEGSKRTDKLFRERFFPLPQLEYVQLGGIAAATLVVFIASIILVFAILTTGATRGKIYRGDKCMMGGRCSASFFVFVTYLLNAAWISIACLLVVPVVGWLVFAKICSEESSYWWSIKQSKEDAKFTYNFNMTHYGFYQNSPESGGSSITDSISGSNAFVQFCTQISTIGPLFLCSFGGTVFVILGLITFLGSLSSNLVRLKYTRELTEFREAAYDQQETELQNMPYQDTYPSYNPNMAHRGGATSSYPHPGSSII